MHPRKIYIIGPVAGGKSTLAGKLSRRLNIPWFELDNVYHQRLPDGDIPRLPEDRFYQFRKIINSDKWIIEGVYRDCFNEGFDKAEVIILLDTPAYKRKYRIIKRWICQKLKLEKSNYTPTFMMLMLMYKWSRNYDRTRKAIIAATAANKEKVIIVGDNKNLEKIFSRC